jgi:hypothetical protein
MAQAQGQRLFPEVSDNPGYSGQKFSVKKKSAEKEKRFFSFEKYYADLIYQLI